MHIFSLKAVTRNIMGAWQRPNGWHRDLYFEISKLTVKFVIFQNNQIKCPTFSIKLSVDSVLSPFALFWVIELRDKPVTDFSERSVWRNIFHRSHVPHSKLSSSKQSPIGSCQEVKTPRVDLFQSRGFEYFARSKAKKKKLDTVENLDSGSLTGHP